DILWMGASCGSKACIANVVRNSVKYNTVKTLESGYGISLRSLAVFAGRTYKNISLTEATLKAISVIQFKLEGQVIMRNPDFEMNDRLLLDKIDYENGTVVSDGKVYALSDTNFPTVDRNNPYELNDEETKITDELKAAFVGSIRLRKHIAFIYENGGMYKTFNDNLLYHGCVPLTELGELDEVKLFTEKMKGKALFDFADMMARHAFFSNQKFLPELDFMWYLWCGKKSPLCGRNIKTFERCFIKDESAWNEEKNPYYKYYYSRETCEMILSEFGLNSPVSHIINGHTPVRTTKGELPIRADGKLIVIDGGFCKDYHEKTGIAGYTLIYNSHGLRLKAHQPFESVAQALSENKDIHSDSEIVETETARVMVEETDDGERIASDINDLRELLRMYRDGKI
ncbi:MAG: fructose-bisphosphatase class III, partial [Ruminococcus sp.]|nr:fructose-bisphosphatase class III [Ruminococcus sp.]